MTPLAPAVCVAGTLCDGRLFAPLIARLPIDPTVVDLSDFDRVEDAARETLSAAPGRFLGIGFSLGGFVILEMLRQAPDRLTGVILLSGNAHPDDPANARVRRDEVAMARVSGMRAHVAARMPPYLGPASLGNTEIEAVILAMAEAAGHDAHARQAEMNIARPDLRDLVRDTPVAMLVVAGDNDALCPSDRYAAAASGTRARLVTLADVGHFVPLEAPDQAAKAISSFLEDIAP